MMSKYKIEMSSRFKKDYKLIQKRNYNVKLLEIVISTLARGETLSENYLDHPLKGNYKGYRECPIAPDWLLVYEICQREFILYLYRTGTHSDLFR